MRCSRGHKLDDDYVGLFCLYCKEPVASIENADGQLALKQKDGNRPKKYLAVIYKDKQRAVSNVEVVSATDRTEIRFNDGESKDDLKTHQVIMAFQDPEERLVI